MYTEVSRHLNEIIQYTQKSDLPAGVKLQAVSSLNYFHTQALCDLDRRDPVGKLKRQWEEFQKFLKGTNLLDKFKLDRSKWEAIETFMGVPVEVPLQVKSSKPAKKESRWTKAEAADFFEFLATASEGRPALNELEMLAIRLGLYYLEAEAKRTRYQRRKDRIRFTWRYVNPLLRKAGMLDQFEGEANLIRRVKSFVSDSIL